MNIPNFKRWLKSLFCDHSYRVIHRYHTPEFEGHEATDTYYLMCSKCGKVIQVNPEQFMIIRERHL
ncbi:hypothetical protein FAM21838_02010 [Lentilactobacillus parabuchneri]|nr:hypothetical protein FAM21838_02010 [Lentilactobacillus parabuchneri]